MISYYRQVCRVISRVGCLHAAELIYAFLDIFRRHIHTKVVRDIYRIIIKYTRQRHASHAVSEMRSIVEISRLKADRAVRKIPEWRNVREPARKIGDLPGIELAVVVVVNRSLNDHEVYAALLAHLFYAAYTVERSLYGALAHFMLAGRIIFKYRIRIKVLVHIAYAFNITHLFVIRARLFVKNVKRLRKVSILHHRLHLIECVARICCQEAPVKSYFVERVSARCVGRHRERQGV